MRKTMTGLVGILSSLVLVGCVDSTRPETYKQDDYKDSSLDVVIDEPVIEEPVAQIIKPESPKPKVEIKPEPEPPPVFTREDIFPTEEEFKYRYSRGILGILESSRDKSYINRTGFHEKIKKITEHPGPALVAFSSSDRKEYEDYFSGELEFLGNVVILNETFPDFDWKKVFDSKMRVYLKDDLDNISEPYKIKLFLDEKLRGYPYAPFEPEKSEYKTDLYFGDMFVEINGKDTKGNNLSFPFWVGNFRFYIDQSNLERQGYRIEEGLTDEQAVEELKKYATNNWIHKGINTRYLSDEDEEKLFYSKDSPLYKVVQETVKKWVGSPDYQPYLRHIAKNRFEEEPTLTKLLIDRSFGIIEEVMVKPGRAGAEAAVEAARHPIRTGIRMRRDERRGR